jgi:lipoate---protein ligase
MQLLCPETHDPAFNLALEEILLKETADEFLILSVNATSVIFGKHQCPCMEIDIEYTFRNRIPLFRRISGGGTVYHDNGNLNFCFISNSEEGKQVDFGKYTRPLIDFLQSRRVPANLFGTSDIKAAGKKISGNAEHVFRKRVLHHGTILFDASLDMLRGSIRSDQSGYSTRAVASNPSPVANLKDLLRSVPDLAVFKNEFADFLLATIDGLELSVCERTYLERAEELAASKYRTWEWNYAYGPDYSFQKTFLYKGSEHSCLFHVKKGIINEVRATGSEEFISLAARLEGCRHLPADIINLYREGNTEISEEEIFKFF